MAIEKREDVFIALSIRATPIVNEKAEIEYLLNNTLQTGTAYVDTETNNLVGPVTPDPAYEQPAAVVQKYLGEQMAALVSSVEQEKSKAAAEAEVAAKELADARAKIDSAADDKAAALADAKAASDQRIALHSQLVEGLKKQIAAHKEEIAALRDLIDALGGTELGQQLAEQKRIDALKQQAQVALASLAAAGQDVREIIESASSQTAPEPLPQ